MLSFKCSDFAWCDVFLVLDFMPGILKKMLRHGHEEQKLDTPKNTSSTLDEGANMFTYKLIEVWSFLVQVDENFFFCLFLCTPDSILELWLAVEVTLLS